MVNDLDTEFPEHFHKPSGRAYISGRSGKIAERVVMGDDKACAAAFIGEIHECSR